jgi:hypothetical protein
MISEKSMISVKKTRWKMSQSDQDPSIPCGRIRIRTERSDLNESLQLKDIVIHHLETK